MFTAGSMKDVQLTNASLNYLFVLKYWVKSTDIKILAYKSNVVFCW